MKGVHVSTLLKGKYPRPTFAKLLFLLISSFTSIAARAIVISTQPSSIAAISEQRNIPFSVIATGTGTLQYEWRVDTNNSGVFSTITSTDTRFSSATTGTLIIPVVVCSMNAYRFQCIITDQAVPASPPVTTGTSTLTVVGCISSPLASLRGNNTLNIPPHAHLANAAFHWQKKRGQIWSPLSDDATYTGTTTPLLNINVIDYAQNLSEYRCEIITTASPTPYHSNTRKLILPGGISPLTNTSGIGGQTFFTVTVPGTGYKYQWQFDDGSGFQNIDPNDTNRYKIQGTPLPKLLLVNVTRDMNNNRYRCLIQDTTYGTVDTTDRASLIVTGNLAPLKFMLTGAIYSQPKEFDDDNPANLTQTYIRCSMPLTERARTGIDLNSKFWDRFIWLRNIFIQVTYSTNVGSLNYVDTNSIKTFNVSGAKNKLVNRLDLYQYAKLNANIMVPIFTYIGGERRRRNNLTNIYLDPYISFLETSVNDSPSAKMNISSVVYGGNLTLRFPLFSNNIQMELNARMFGLTPISNGINPNYNFQYARRSDYDSTSARNGTGKSIIGQNRPFYNFDGLIIYNTSKDNDGAQLFIHYSLFGNLLTDKAQNEKNSFYQLQIGYSTDLMKFAQNLLKTILPK